MAIALENLLGSHSESDQPSPGPSLRMGCHLTESTGFLGRSAHILTYEPHNMPSPLLLPFVANSLMPSARKAFLLRHALITVYTLCIGLLFNFIPGAREVAEHQLNVFADGTVQFRTITSYLIGGFALQTVVAWNSRRTNYAALCGSMRDLCIQLGSLLPLPSSSSNSEDLAEEAKASPALETRRTLARWCVLAHELAVLKSRGAMDQPDAKEFLLRTGLLVDGEWGCMVPGDRQTTILFWIQARVKQLMVKGDLSQNELLIISNSISLYRAQANDLMGSLARDLPFPYAGFVSFLAHTTIFFLASTDGLNLATDYDSGQDEGAQWHTWVTQLGCTFVLSSCYGAYIELQGVLHNPFGARRLDVAHDTIAAGLRRLAESVVANPGPVTPGQTSPPTISA